MTIYCNKKRWETHEKRVEANFRYSEQKDMEKFAEQIPYTDTYHLCLYIMVNLILHIMMNLFLSSSVYALLP